MLNVLRESFQGGTGRWIKIGLLLAVAVSMVAYLGGYFFGLIEYPRKKYMSAALFNNTVRSAA